MNRLFRLALTGFLAVPALADPSFMPGDAEKPEKPVYRVYNESLNVSNFEVPSHLSPVDNDSRLPRMEDYSRSPGSSFQDLVPPIPNSIQSVRPQQPRDGEDDEDPQSGWGWLADEVMKSRRDKEAVQAEAVSEEEEEQRARDAQAPSVLRSFDDPDRPSLFRSDDGMFIQSFREDEEDRTDTAVAAVDGREPFTARDEDLDDRNEASAFGDNRDRPEPATRFQDSWSREETTFGNESIWGSSMVFGDYESAGLVDPEIVRAQQMAERESRFEDNRPSMVSQIINHPIPLVEKFQERQRDGMFGSQAASSSFGIASPGGSGAGRYETSYGAPPSGADAFSAGMFRDYSRINTLSGSYDDDRGSRFQSSFGQPADSRGGSLLSSPGTLGSESTIRSSALPW